MSQDLQIEVHNSHETDPTETLMKGYAECIKMHGGPPKKIIMNAIQASNMKSKFHDFMSAEQRAEERMRIKILKELEMEDPREWRCMGIPVEVRDVEYEITEKGRKFVEDMLKNER